MPTFQAELADGSTIEFEAEREPTAQELADAINQQYKPAKEPAQPEVGAGKAFLQHAVAGIAPGAAFIAGAEPGAAAGATLGTAIWPGPGTAIGGGIGALVTGIPAAMGAAYGQRKLVEAVAPEFAKKTEAEMVAGEQQHPIASIAGDIASFSPSAKFAPLKLATLPTRLGLGATAGAVLPVITEQRTPGWKDVAVGAATGAIFGEGRFKLLPRATAQAALDIKTATGKTRLEATGPNAAEILRKQAATARKAGQEAPIDVEGTDITPAESKRPTEAISPEGELPPVQPGYVRMYHGGADPTGELNSPRDITQYPDYAAGYAAKSSGSDVWYVDVPEDAPFMKKAFDEFPGSPKSPFINTTAPAEIMRKARRMAKPEVVTPEDQTYLDAERAAIDAGKIEGSPVKIVDKFSGETPDLPFAGQFMRPTPEGIEVKAPEFRKWLDTVPPEQRPAAIQQRILEEHIHRQVGTEDAKGYWNTLSTLEQAAERRAYTGKWSQAGVKAKYGEGFSDTQLGHEAVRRRMQRLATGSSSEIAEAAIAERWKLEGLDALSGIVRKTREALGTKASQQGLAILDQVESNLNVARTAVSGGQPAGLNKQHKKGEIQPGQELSLGPTKGGALTKPETAPAAEAARVPEIAPLNPEAIRNEAGRHFTETSRPSFGEFVADAKTKFGANLQPGQLREAFEDAMWPKLTEAPGSEISRLLSQLGLNRKIARGQTGRLTIADPLPETKGFQLEVQQVRSARELTEEGRQRQVMEQRVRAHAIATIADKLMSEAAEGKKAWRRTEIGPEDVRLSETEASGPTVRAIDPSETANPETLGRILTTGATMERSTVKRKMLGGKVIETRMKAPPETVTKRLTAFVNNTTGVVDLVSTYPHSRKGAMVVDPLRLGKMKPNTQLADVLPRATPIYSFLLDEPVQNFHQRFGSVREFEERFAEPAKAAAESAGKVYPVPGETEVTAAPFQAPMTDTEASALLDHILGEVGKFDSPEDVKASLTAIGEKDRVVRSGYGKLARELEKQHPDWPTEDLLEVLANQIYENHKTAKSLEEFTARTMAQAGAKAGEAARPEVQAPSKFSKELTLPINRVPPTTLRPEMVPPGSIPEKVAPPPNVERAPGGKPPEMLSPEAEAKLKEEIEARSQYRPLQAPDETPAGLRKEFQAAKDEISAIGRMVKGLVANRGTVEQAAYTADRAHNEANIFARGIEMGIRFLSSNKPDSFKNPAERGDPQVLAAANALVQAGFKRSKLYWFKQDVARGRVKATEMANKTNWRERRLGKAWIALCDQLDAELDFAKKNWDDPVLQRTAKRMASAIKEQRDLEVSHGVDVTEKDNYLPQRYDQALWMGDSVFLSAPRIWGTKFREPGKFESYYQAAASGPYLAVTRDGASLVAHRIRQGMNMLNRKQWEIGLRGITTPEGKPLSMAPKEIEPGKFSSPGAEYENVRTPENPLYVHSDFANSIKALIEESPFHHGSFLGEALHFEQKLKHLLLVGDFFHFFRMGYYGTAIMGRKAGWKKGWSVLDIQPRDIPMAVERGIITPEQAKWAEEKVAYNGTEITNRELLGNATRLGLNVGRIQDALYKDLLTNLTPTAGPIKRGFNRVIDPTVGRGNRFLFDKFTRGLMAESVVHEFRRQAPQHPNTPSDVLLRDIVRDTNNFYGNIGRQGWFKSQFARDMASLFTLAPQWVEGLVKKEAVGMSRLSGLSKLAGQRQGVSALGTTGNAIGRGLLAMFAITQAINLYTRKKPTWQNDEEGHKLDAWIPSYDKNKEGFWFSPLAIFNELTHDLYRLMESKPKGIEAIQQIFGNKESPLTRAILIGVAGQNPRGEYQTTSAGQLGGALQQLAPVPITFGKYAQAAGHAIAPESVPATAPGALQRQFFGTFGVKVEPAASAASNVNRMAKDFMKKEGLEKTTGWTEIQTDEPGYTKLRQALRSGDEEAAKKNLEALRKNRSDKDIIKAMNQWAKRGFTGSKKTEKYFLASLDEKGLAQYDKALESKYAELENFYAFITKQPGN